MNRWLRKSLQVKYETIGGLVLYMMLPVIMQCCDFFSNLDLLQTRPLDDFEDVKRGGATNV